jgi:hypothetical protein
MAREVPALRAYRKIVEPNPVINTTGRGCADPPGLNVQLPNCKCRSYFFEALKWWHCEIAVRNAV